MCVAERVHVKRTRGRSNEMCVAERGMAVHITVTASTVMLHYQNRVVRYIATVDVHHGQIDVCRLEKLLLNG